MSSLFRNSLGQGNGNSMCTSKLLFLIRNWKILMEENE